MKRALKWLKRIVLGTLAFVVVVVIVLLILLRTSWGTEKVLSIARSLILDEKFPGGLKVGRVEGSALTDLELYDVTVNGLDGKPMLVAKKITANVALSALFSKRIEVEKLIIEGADVVDPRNPVVLSESKEPLDWQIVFPKVELRDSRVALSGEQPMTFEKLDLIASADIRLDNPEAPNIKAAVALNGFWKEQMLAFDVRADAHIGKTITLSKLVAKLGDSKVEAKKPIEFDPAKPMQPVAALEITATPNVVGKFAPQVTLTGTAVVNVDITRAGDESKIDLTAKMGNTSLFAALVADLANQRARGIITADGVDIGTYIPSLTGTGSGTVTIVGDGKARTANVTAILQGQLLDLPPGHAVVGASASETGAHVVLVAGGDGGLGTALTGRLARDGDKLDLLGASVITTVRDASKVSNRKVPFRGAITAGGNVKGSLAPKLDIQLDGFVRGNGLATTDPKMGGITIANVNGSARARISEAGTYSHLKATVKTLGRGGELLAESLEVEAKNQKDGTIAVTVNARPAAVPHMVANLDATVDLGRHDADPISITLGDYTVSAPRIAQWKGQGGTIVIREETVDIAGINSTSSGGASLVVENVQLVKATGGLDVKANLKRVPLGMVSPKYTGTVSANVDLKRRGIQWHGKANVQANGVSLGPDTPTIEGTVAVTVANRRVTADVNATSLTVGGVRLVLDVEGPRDITDPNGWRALDRKAIKTAMLGLTRIDLAAAKVPTGGIVEGELVLTGTDTSGTFKVRGVQTAVGPVEGEINFAPIGDELGISSNIKVGDYGTANIAGQIIIPSHPFEPNDWKKHGRGIVRVLTASIEDVLIDDKRLAPFGVTTPYSGRVSVNVALAAGASKATVGVDIKDIRGGVLKIPLDVRVEAATSPTDTRASVVASTQKKPLLTVEGTLPQWGFDRWIADPGAVLHTQLTGKLDIPEQEVVDLLAIIGRRDVKNGKLRGAIDVVGTVGKPTAGGEILVSRVDLKPRLAGRALPTLEELKITPKWDGTEANIVIKGKESTPVKDKPPEIATIDITARVKPSDVDNLLASVVMKNFDIAPVAVFLPGPLVAATGKLSTNITIRGLTPDKIRGSLKLEKGRAPITPEVGTVRDTNLDVKLTDAGLTYKLSAKIGSGNAKLEGEAPADLSKIVFRGTVEKFSPIHEIAPVISTNLDGTIFREEGLLRAEAKLTKSTVSLDMEQGVKLLPDEMPEDLFIGRKTAPPPVSKQQRLPRKPWITVKVALDSTPVYVKHEFFELRARARSSGVTLSIGRTIGLDGSIDIERGDVDVLGRHYRVDPGPDKIIFDGSTDPELRIRLTHDFPELTLTADISGRASKREIHMTGIPNTYTQDELFAFFLGGDPGGGAGSQSRDVAANAGAAVLSAKLASTAKKIIPIKVDVVSCDAGSATSSSACRFGRWLSENMLVVVKTRVAPRPDEPTSNVEVQYYFRKNWLLEGAGTTDRGSLDVLWRKRW